MAYRVRKVPSDAYGFRVPAWMNQLNNMPEADVSDFNTINVYILDDVLRGPDVHVGAGSLRAVQHESCCNDFYDVVTNVIDDCNVHSVRMQAGQRRHEFTLYIARELAKYSSRDLVIFYYHGKAGWKGDNYTWKFRGPGPRRINAHDFVCQVNGSEPDCYFILDCFVPTNFSKEWERKDAMTEFSITGQQLRNGDAQPINGPENFTETFCRALRDIRLRPRGRPRQSVHTVMARDRVQCSRPMRLWTARPNRRKDAEVWRFFLDIGRFKETGRLELRKCRVTGRRSGDGEFDDSDDDGSGDSDEDEEEDDDGDDGGEDGGESDNDQGHGGNEDDDTRGDRGLDRRIDDRHHGNDNKDTDTTSQQLRKQLNRQLRKIPEGGLHDSPEVMRRMRGLLNCLQPARQQSERAPKRPRLFGQQLPSNGLGEGEIVGPSDGDDGESLFIPRDSSQHPAAKRAKRLAGSPSRNVGHRTNIMDLGDEDETAIDANNASLIDRLVDTINNNDDRRGRRATPRVDSPVPKEEKKDDLKRSSSPSFDFGDILSPSDFDTIKRERSTSPGVEITGSRPIRGYVDLTLDDEVVDLTQEDGPE